MVYGTVPQTTTMIIPGQVQMFTSQILNYTLLHKWNV